MADNENVRKSYYSRRNAPNRPPPGVQKAMINFGVRDLREIINKKRQEQGVPLDDTDKTLQTKQKQPPPDPSYNYLHDPTRDRPKSPPPKKEENKRSQEQHPRNRDFQRPKFKNEQYENTQHYRNRKQENNNLPSRTFPETSPSSKEDNNTTKKELRFSDVPRDIDGDPQVSRGGRSSLRGRNPRRVSGGKPKDEKIENPVNIKIQLSIETGQRSCTLDENTKIPDIKHVPDQPHRSPRGSFRGARGNFKGRGRSKNSFRERRTSNRTNQPENEKIKEYDDCETNKADHIETAGQDSETHLEDYEDCDQENNETDEFVDSNENYDHEDSVDRTQRPEQTAQDSYDPNFAQTITITSSKYQDGELKRSIEIKPTDVEYGKEKE